MDVIPAKPMNLYLNEQQRLKDARLSKSSEKFEIYRLSEKYLDEISEIHMRLFENDLISQFGKEFVKNRFYKLLLSDSRSDGFLCLSNGEVCGYIIGISDSNDFYRIFKKKNILKMFFMIFNFSFYFSGKLKMILNYLKYTFRHDYGTEGA